MVNAMKAHVYVTANLVTLVLCAGQRWTTAKIAGRITHAQTDLVSTMSMDLLASAIKVLLENYARF